MKTTPTPIQEGSTKSNVKKHDGKGRQAPPPPPPPKSRILREDGIGLVPPKYIKLTLIILLATLASCSTAWHYNKIERKDPNFWSQFNDTIQMPFVTYDTIFHNGDTIAIIQRIEYRDTIIQVRTIAPRTRHDRKAEANQLRHELKMEREQTKQAKHENKTLRVQARTERTQTRVEGRTKRTEARTQRRGARTFLLCLISFVVGCLVGMGFMFQHKNKVLRWIGNF